MVDLAVRSDLICQLEALTIAIYNRYCMNVAQTVKRYKGVA